eukprot:6197469-Pleurochrysis_carterae.AAC.1
MFDIVRRPDHLFSTKSGTSKTLVSKRIYAPRLDLLYLSTINSLVPAPGDSLCTAWIREVSRQAHEGNLMRDTQPIGGGHIRHRSGAGAYMLREDSYLTTLPAALATCLLSRAAAATPRSGRTVQFRPPTIPGARAGGAWPLVGVLRGACAPCRLGVERGHTHPMSGAGKGVITQLHLAAHT